MVRPAHPSPELSSAISRALEEQVVTWRPVSGGFSSAGLWVVETPSGRRRFVKAATSDDTARFLRDEMVVYGQVDAHFLPEVETFVDDGNRPFLIVEDLSGHHWPPPWSRSQIDAVWQTCDAIASTPAPIGLSRDAQDALSEMFWPQIAANPHLVHELDVASTAWFDDALPLLVELEQTAVIAGDALVHADIRSDNVCIGVGVKVVDWNWAFVGNPMLDIVAWLPSLYLEGGPPPWQLLTGEGGLVARLAGFFLQHATKPRQPDVRDDIREFQQAQGTVALTWAARELGIEAPIPPA